MSTMQTPRPDAPVPAGPPERRCPRCGSTLAPDQEWCLACGAAAETEVVEARGWRVPLYLGGGLAALAVLGVILAIVALASRNDEVAQNPNATATPSAVPTAPPGTAPAPSGTPGGPLPTTTPAPSVSPVPTETASPEASPTEDPPNTDDSFGTAFPEWTGADGDYTVILKSSTTKSGAERAAQDAQDAGEADIGILESEQYSSLNSGYWVVFSGAYASKGEAEDALDAIKASFPDAYIRQIKQ